MEQSFSAADSSLDGHKTPCNLLSRVVHCCVLNIIPLDPILSQINPVHTLPSQSKF